jgi:phage tail-like protein
MTVLPDLVQTFRFSVDLTRSSSTEPQGDWPSSLGTGGFSECSGLTLEADVKEILEGGFNFGIVRRTGRVKLEPLVLKRGMFLKNKGGLADSTLWDWLSATVYGLLPIPRYDGVVTVMDPSNKNVTATWCFDRGLPIKVAGPSLNAKTGEVAIEELHIAHEGLRLGPPMSAGANA